MEEKGQERDKKKHRSLFPWKAELNEHAEMEDVCERE